MYESSSNVYLTDRDGEITDSKEIHYKAIGKCVNCYKEYEMMQTSYGFVPLTPLRKLLYEYDKGIFDVEESLIDKDSKNPMLITKEEKRNV